MGRTTGRREFFVNSLAAAGAACIGMPVAHAIEPIARPSGSQFKFSLAAYSYRDLFKAKKHPLTVDDFLDDCAKFGLDGTELTSYYLPQEPSAKYLRELKAAAFRRGLDVSGTAIGNDFCFPPGDRRKREIAHVKQWIEYADMMDAPVIRIFSGIAKPGQSASDAHQLAIEAIEECCQHAAKYGVFLALENHGGLTTKADDMLAIVHGVQSLWFGVNMDTGNFRTADVYDDLVKIAPYTVNVQVKVVIHPNDKSTEPSDFKRLATILKTAGYRGYIVLEFEESGDSRQECEKYLGQIRAAFV